MALRQPCHRHVRHAVEDLREGAGKDLVLLRQGHGDVLQRLGNRLQRGLHDMLLALEELVHERRDLGAGGGFTGLFLELGDPLLHAEGEGDARLLDLLEACFEGANKRLLLEQVQDLRRRLADGQVDHARYQIVGGHGLSLKKRQLLLAEEPLHSRQISAKRPSHLGGRVHVRAPLGGVLIQVVVDRAERVSHHYPLEARTPEKPGRAQGGGGELELKDKQCEKPQQTMEAAKPFSPHAPCRKGVVRLASVVGPP
mmetsp:Transcript_113948/g.302814  ORF Transcript_113948/g.302814 Transcript_113948/m.302814 type:complete len:255 (-) Transcript_113948:27-791(-)